MAEKGKETEGVAKSPLQLVNSVQVAPGRYVSAAVSDEFQTYRRIRRARKDNDCKIELMNVADIVSE